MPSKKSPYVVKVRNNYVGYLYHLINITLLWKCFFEGQTETLLQTKNSVGLLLNQHTQTSSHFI